MYKRNNSADAKIELKICNHKVDVCCKSDFDIHFIGAGFTQIVDDDLRIHAPLNDCTVQLSFEITDRKSGVKTEKDIPLLVPGKYGASHGKKPAVVPEPAQWVYLDGDTVKPQMLKAVKYSKHTEKVARTFSDDFIKFFKKKLPVVSIEETPGISVTFILNDELDYLGEEGYTVFSGDGGIKLQSCSLKGLFWAGRTVLQLLAQGGFPSGKMVDYPRFSVRGFMIDVARKPVSMDMLNKIVDFMSWFKMNDLHIHLNDNYIWLEDYAKNRESSTFHAYEAFRLETDVSNQYGKTPTSKDYFYTKDEFRDFINKAAERCVRIVPEIDFPAHALSFSKIFPEHMVKDKISPLMAGRPLTDHLDISRPDTVDFIKKIFDEYIKGDKPVFPADTVIHLGADEFLSDYGAYRRFINEIVPYLKQTHPVRFWGGLSWIKDKPETPVNQRAIQDVQLNLWSCDWADGREMYKMGFKLINTIDSYLYIVPDGSGRRGSYKDYLNTKRIFKKFTPNCVRVKGGKFVHLPEGNKQLIGASFALWNDNIDMRASGLAESDLFDRFADAAPFLADKTWGNREQRRGFKSFKKAAFIAVQNYISSDKDIYSNSDIKSNKIRQVVRFLKSAIYTEKKSFITTGMYAAPVGSVVDIDMILLKKSNNKIIMESDAPYGTYDIRITENGKLGFTREGYIYEFNYVVPVGKRVRLRLKTSPLKTVLYAGFSRKRAVGKFIHESTVRCLNIKKSTLSVPCERIGAPTNAVNAVIYSVCLYI